MLKKIAEGIRNVVIWCVCTGILVGIAYGISCLVDDNPGYADHQECRQAQQSANYISRKSIAASKAYHLQHREQEKAHRLQKRRMARKEKFGGFLWFMVIIVLPMLVWSDKGVKLHQQGKTGVPSGLDRR